MKMTYMKKKIKDLAIKKTAHWRRKKLVATDFTIISNNCWAGDVYRYFGLPYQTPTVGMYFFADEYIRFCNNLPHYLTTPIEPLDFCDSKYQKELEQKGQTKKLLAHLDDVEIVLLHYTSWDEAREKWERRAKRVNFDRLIVKNSRQNGCTNENIEDFLKMPHKILFLDNHPSEHPNVVYISGYEHEKYLLDDISTYRKHMDILKFLNEG